MDRSKHSIVLLRGLPGSGKSTLARALSCDGQHPVFSVDDYFTNEDGEYKFDFTRNHLAYKQCETNTEKAVAEGKPLILVDNTFTLDWEMQPYFIIAEKFNCPIHVVTVENYHGNKNVHDVSEEQISKMKEKYKVKLTGK